jgi:hypothetical protein
MTAGLILEKPDGKTIADHLLIAMTEIETGEPWYQPQAYAVAAQRDCEAAVAAIIEFGVTDSTVKLAVETMIMASQLAASSSVEQRVYGWAVRINELWHAKRREHQS